MASSEFQNTPNLFFGQQRDFEIADVTRDGHADLLGSTWQDDIWVVLGTGDGTFQPLHTFDSAEEVRDILVADLDNRRGLDVAFVQSIGLGGPGDRIVPLLSQAEIPSDPSAPAVLTATSGEASDTLELTGDIATPTLAIASPPEGSVVAGNAVTITGLVSAASRVPRTRARSRAAASCPSTKACSWCWT